MQSLGKNDLRTIHVIEATWLVFSRYALQSDCLAKANASYAHGKLTDVLLAVGAILKFKEQKCVKFCHDLPIQGLLVRNDTARRMEIILAHLMKKQTQIHTTRVHVFTDPVSCSGSGAMRDPSGMWKLEADRFPEDPVLSQPMVLQHNKSDAASRRTRYVAHLH